MTLRQGDTREIKYEARSGKAVEGGMWGEEGVLCDKRDLVLVLLAGCTYITEAPFPDLATS